jgi:hypothetical protein
MVNQQPLPEVFISSEDTIDQPVLQTEDGSTFTFRGAKARCPRCWEQIHPKARVCIHCNIEFSAEDVKARLIFLDQAHVRFQMRLLRGIAGGALLAIAGFWFAANP